MKEEVFRTLPPGIYIEKEEPGAPVLELAPTGIAGFLGLAVRGPTDRPVAIRSIEEFHAVYGDPKGRGFLEHAVEGFFLNGGAVVHIVRVTHKGPHPSTSAYKDLVDEKGIPTLRIVANSEGDWGNEIEILVRRPEPRVRTVLTLDAPKGSTSMMVSSTHGIGRGTLIRIRDPKGEEYRYVTEVREKVLRFSEPLKRGFRMDGPTYIEPIVFDLEVKYKDQRERYENLSMFKASPEYAPRVINSRSALVKAFDLGSPSEVPANLPAATDPLNLEGGFEDWGLVRPEDFLGLSSGDEVKRGLELLEGIEEIELIAAPDIMYLYGLNREQLGKPFSSLNDIKIVQEELVSHCERLKGRFAILDSPYPRDLNKTAEWRKGFDSSHAALYFPWLKVDKNGQILEIPPSGHMAGLYAGSDEKWGVHKAPANVQIEGVADVAAELWEEELGFLNSQGINALRRIGGGGIVPWGARTLSSNPIHRYINVRRVVSVIIRSLDLYMQWVVFEPNTPKLWKAITRQVGYFLTTLWRKGFFQGSTPEEAFFVKCDEETNPPELRDQGFLVVEVGVAPVRPAEFIIFHLAQEMQQPEGG